MKTRQYWGLAKVACEWLLLLPFPVRLLQLGRARLVAREHLCEFRLSLGQEQVLNPE